MKTWTPAAIEGLRKDMCLTQSGFAQRLGVTGNYIYLLEKGVKEPSDTLKLLLDCVGKKHRETKTKKKGR